MSNDAGRKRVHPDNPPQLTPEQQTANINKNTTVTLGLVIAVLAVTGAGILGGVWWASAMTTKMDMVVKAGDKRDERITVLEKDTLRTEHLRPLVRAIVEEMIKNLAMRPEDIQSMVEDLIEQMIDERS